MRITILDIFWLLIIVWSFVPLLSRQTRDSHRYRVIRNFEKGRRSRVITLIHRQESTNLFGMTFGRHIDIEDSEQVLRAIRLTDPNVPIDIVLHTPGGLVLATEQIAHAIKNHPAKVTVFVPHYAMSGGTLIALAADEIVMDPNAVLGPVDPQIGSYPAASILSAVARKPVAELDDQTLILADVSEKALKQVHGLIMKILADKMPPEKAAEITDQLSTGRWTHDYPITCEELKQMGLSVRTDMPREIYDLMELYPQAASRKRPSVGYIPLPYGVRGEQPKQRD
ncbi:MAG TPA: enoyl-CoA hydratase-related protein [Bacillota bacterium]|jgi:ClpP class serine protease|nr:enoyl-CoA hydratase-related protein [Bacillota bacterium]HQD80163.1 enoyl-CoA hydratase-related protein [Bacillota bacterium]